MALNLGIDHVAPWIRERGLHRFHRSQPHLHRVQPIDAPFRKRIEIRAQNKKLGKGKESPKSVRRASHLKTKTTSSPTVF